MATSPVMQYIFKVIPLVVLHSPYETWKVNERENRGVDTLNCPRRILKVRWPYIMSNKDILNKTTLEKISTEVKIRRWEWIGHMFRKAEDSHCMTTLTWTPEGTRKLGRPKTTWRKIVERQDGRKKKSGMKTCSEAKQMAKGRTSWGRNTEPLWPMGPDEDRSGKVTTFSKHSTADELFF